MSYTLSKTGAQIDAILNKAEASGIIQKSSATYAGVLAALALGSPVIIQDGSDMYQYVGAIGPTLFFSQMSTIDNYIPGAYLKGLALTSQDVWSSTTRSLQDKLTFDSTPTLNSTNPVTSDGIAKAIGNTETGTFPGMTVGASDNLISDTKIANSSPYLYRPVISGVGNRAWQKLVGATIANNQMIKMDTDWVADRATTSYADGVRAFTANDANGQIYQVFRKVQNHVYLLLFDAKSTGNYTLRTDIYGAYPRGWSLTSSWQSFNLLYKDIYVGSVTRLYLKDTSASDWAEISLRNIMLVDITAMFGAEIANYAYSIASGGAGVAWLKSYGFFSKYAPYDAGSLISTKAEGKRVTGRNLFDSSTATILAAYFDGNNLVANGNNACSYMPCKPNTTYTIQRKRISGDGANTLVLGYTNGNTPPTGGSVCLDNQSVSISSGATANVSITTSADATYLVFYLGRSGYAAETIETVQIELGSTAHAYEDYITPKTYDLGSDELRGLFKLDANNNIYADGDIKTPDGQITRKYDIVDLGTLTWAVYNAEEGKFRAYNDGTIKSGVTAAICSKYDDVMLYDTWSTTDKTICISTTFSTGFGVFVHDSNLANKTGSEVKTAMNGVYLVYELATPTTEQGTPFIDPSIVYPNGTEEYIDTRTVPVPVGNETEYTEDLKGGLETILDTPPANGTYVLKATVSGGVATLSWVSE